MVYDGFMSYSHAADDRLAPALQQGLQRLAKPWNSRRALRIFRDETGLSTNPGMPIYLAQGTHDEQVPLEVTAELETDYCRLGANLSRHVYPNVDHNGVLDAAQVDVLAWLSDRYAGRPATSDCRCPAR